MLNSNSVKLDSTLLRIHDLLCLLCSLLVSVSVNCVVVVAAMTDI